MENQKFGVSQFAEQINYQRALEGELERTLIIVSGDHGMPGVPSGKCNLYDHGVSVALVVASAALTP